MKSKTKIDKILTEYEKAQDSAEHHNNSMWNLIYIGLGLSLAIIYIFWTTDTRIDSVKIDTIKYIMLIFGSIILAYFIKIIKYLVYKTITPTNSLLAPFQIFVRRGDRN